MRSPVSRSAVALLTSLSMACGGRGCGSSSGSAPGSLNGGAVQESPVAPATVSYSAQRLDGIHAAIDAGQKAIPRESFDPGAIVRQVGNDPARLSRWVRDNSAWVPYRGALRGPVGVLLDGFGNSLDRSLLLAELLRLAGHTTRVARTSLDDRTAHELLGQVRPLQHPAARPASDGSGQPAGMNLEDLVTQRGLDATQASRIVAEFVQRSETMSQELSQRVSKQVPFLSDVVGTPRAESAGNEDGRWLSALRDHWWVQRLDGSRWVDLDLILPGAPETPHRPAEETFRYDATRPSILLPSQYVQEIELRVVIERWRSGTVEKATVLSHALRPAELFGVPIRLEHGLAGAPAGRSFMAEANPIVALQTAVRDQQEWLPVLTIGEKQYSQSIFTVGGEVKAASSGKGGPAASSFGGGLDALGGGDETPADAPGHLIAEWLEFEIRVPGQPSTTIRRDVFDLLPGSFRTTQPVASPVFGETARLARGLAMLGTIQLLPVAARLTPQFIENEVVEGHRANRQALADLRSAAVAGDMAALEKSLSGFRPVSDPLLSLALGRFAWSPVAADVYLSQPNILAYRTKLSIDQTGRLASRQGFDIVANEVAVRWGSPALPFAVRLTQGATDTNLEALLVDGRMGNAGTMLDGTLAKEGSWITLRGPGDLKLASGLPEDQRRRIEQTLASGYLAVIPRATASGDSAWWRVHPTRGDALGIGTDGWGQGLTEALIQKSVVAVLTAFVAGFLCSAIACMATSSSFELSSGRFTPNANTASEAASCVCVGVGVGALAGGLILPFLKMSSGMAIGAAAIGRTASLEASLRTFQVGAGALMTLIRMARDTVCSFGGT